MTGRRLEILTQLAKGRTQAEIAEELQITQVTIASELVRAKNDWGAATTIEVVVMAISKGLVKI